MKLSIIFFAFLTSINSFSQKLTLNDLTSLCNKKNWEDVNQFLISKGWTYYDSEKGDTYKYNTITWSYDKDYYSDKAKGWFYLYTYEGFPNKISYSIFNKESYTLVQNLIFKAGFKLMKSEIENNEVVSTYVNSNFTLKISNEKRSQNDFYERSITAYNITLIKKAGVYDPDNGKKIEYYSNGVVKSEYILQNGKGNGEFKQYYDNGKIRVTGNYINGIESGKFIEYNEDGSILAECYFKNGKKNGILNSYENGKISYSTMIKDDLKNGEYIEYYYTEAGILYLKLTGHYLNDLKNGIWKLTYLNDSKPQVLTIENYINGIKNGPFQDIKEDSLIIGNYKNDKLHGTYKVYLDFSKTIFGGVINTDTSEIALIIEGQYYENMKTGYWKEFNFDQTLNVEGYYLNDYKNGEWKYYYSNYLNTQGIPEHYSKELYLVENYKQGKLEGKSLRYSYLKEEKYPCIETIPNRNPLDTCSKYIYQKITEISFYQRGQLNGPFELRDSLNQIIAQGNFINDSKEGEWVHRYTEKDINGDAYFIFQKGKYFEDKREGEWIEFFIEGEILKSFNYKNGLLHGEHILWIKKDKPKEKKQFNFGKLQKLITYDSLGIKPLSEYEIYEESPIGYKCKRTIYNQDNYISQEYWIEKQDDGDEIDHELFEIVFLLKSGKYGDGKIYPDGIFIINDLMNNPIIIGKYYKETKVGTWTFYYYDQKVKIEKNYANNEAIDEKYFNLFGNVYSGEFIYTDPTNKLKEIRKIKEGLRNGKTVFIDPATNKIIKKEVYKNGILK